MDSDGSPSADLKIKSLATSLANPAEIVSVWAEKAQSGTLTSAHIKEYWRQHVPRIFCPEPNSSCIHLTFDEEEAQRVLLDPLNQFICQGKPDDFFQSLKQLDDPPRLCGKVFKMGEPTYSCRDCGMDPTCVLCVSCFKNSPHKKHRYKMSTSMGGGYCDCGDTEAWKQDHCCQLHSFQESETGERNPLLRMPTDLVERTRIILNTVIQYTYDLLTKEMAMHLPSDLQLKETEQASLCQEDRNDTFCTVLYNDESHTFELVISTLCRALNCNQKDAIDFATIIDREGRSLVRCSSYRNCSEVKTVIERHTSRHGYTPLKVLVVHCHVLAHQTFALRLLTWLKKILEYSEGFRALFSEIMLFPPDSSILEGILLCDTNLWKMARNSWHHLLISGMLMDYDSKKMFSKIFAKKYPELIKDFIRDDHDHAFSVTSLSVQIFTVPTLSHYLIAEENLLSLLMKTFLSECEHKLNAAGKLEFDRNSGNQPFRRSHYVLYDMKYLLSAVPDQWSNALRKGFLSGLSEMLKLLSYMQGMDVVVRQVGQHMEFEPEWESGFTMHLRLAPVISLLLKWCGSDRVVLIKAYRLTLKKLRDCYMSEMQRQGVVQELADHSVACLQYDVATKPISIHLPLSRFLAGLHLYLERHHLTFDMSDFVIKDKPTPEQIIEPVLRNQVMIAQIQAGMWRRNGYSLLNQLYFYRNVRCRTEMLDRDVALLQIGAALIESNEFLIHVLHKFNLVGWAQPDFETAALRNSEEDSMRQISTLVEEFLRLIIYLVSERFIVGIGKGVTPDDQVKKEIVQLLCIEPMPHSALNKGLPEDANHETGMEHVIEEVAVFKKPTQSNGKGVYELKPEFHKEYNLFFYHYMREEQSKSEEAQRKRSKETGEPECCPPPSVPPFTEDFKMVANLLQCDVMLHVMKTVLERAINLRARSFSEPQFHKILHLIGCALLEEESQSTEDVQFFVFTTQAEKRNILGLLESLLGSPRIEAYKDLLNWTVKKYRHVLALGRKSDSAQETSMDATESSALDEAEAAKKEKMKKSKLAAARRAKIMAQMTTMQKNFMKENAKLFEVSEEELEKSRGVSGSAMDLTDPADEILVAVGPHRTVMPFPEIRHTCILCQEDQVVEIGARALVLPGYVQKSTVLCKSRSLLREEGAVSQSQVFLPSNLLHGTVTSTCGHLMHSQCWRKYYENVLLKERRRPYRLRQPLSFDVEKQEYLCPLCECISNTVLPVVPPLSALSQSSLESCDNISFADWLRGLQIALKYKKKLSNEEHKGDSERMTECYYTCPKDQVVIEMGEAGPSFSSLFEVNEEGECSETLTEMVRLFALATFTTGLSTNPDEKDDRVPLVTWQTCAYTVHTIEWLLQEEAKPLFGQLSSRQEDCLKALVRVCGILGRNLDQPKVFASHALRILSRLLSGSEDELCILQCDALGTLIPLVFSLPHVFSSDKPAKVSCGGVQDLHVLRLILISHIVQILLTSDFEPFVPMDVDENPGTDEEDFSAVVILLKEVRKAAGLCQDSEADESFNDSAVWQQVKDASLSFLRCSALFFHFATSIAPLKVLLENGGDTFENLCMYLGLPIDCNELLGDPEVLELAVRWASHKQVHESLSSASNNCVIRYPMDVNRLVALPMDYSEIINNVSLFTCPNSEGEDSRTPTMCLICGEMLCSQSYCCQLELDGQLVGACTYHAQHCGAGVGIFLRVRECKVLLMAGKSKGCFVLPPYLDSYGETDQGLRRGNPLHLCADRYQRLHRMWLSHRIPEEIAHAVETSSNVVMEWYHL